MTIPERDKVVAIAIPAVLLAGFLVFVGYGWMQEHDARLKAEAQTGQQQKQIDGLKQQQAEAQDSLNKQLSALEKSRQTRATATQLVSDASALLPNLPVPLQVQTAPKDPSLPDAPATQTVIIPEADFKSIRDGQVTCEENAAKLATCQTLTDESKQQLQLTEQQRDEWKTAAKGGSLWHRALGAAKWFAVGAGAGAGLYAVTHHK
jgi:cytochrome oxidase assembly protein ShyY1